MFVFYLKRMTQFVKSILKVGKYHSPDGVVEVTRDRLKHWESGFLNLSNSGYAIPIDWNHAEDLSEAAPVLKKDRSAANTVGNLSGFRVSDDGESAEITLDVSDRRGAEQADSNRVFVSPVIFPEWKDGSGRIHKDVITHVDFVNHPVDYTQSPFKKIDSTPVVACAIRMGLSKPFAMSAEMGDEDEEKTSDAMAEATETVPDPVDPRVTALISALADMGINLPAMPAAATPDDLINALHDALVAGGPQDETAEVNGGTEGPKMATTDPGYAAMSLRAKQSTDYATKLHRKSIITRLDALLKDGKCTPAEHNDQKTRVEAVRLSLDKNGDPLNTPAEDWIACREPLPKGALWSSVQRTRMGLTVPDPKTGDATAETPESAEKIADEVYKKK